MTPEQKERREGEKMSDRIKARMSKPKGKRENERPQRYCKAVKKQRKKMSDEIKARMSKPKGGRKNERTQRNCKAAKTEREPTKMSELNNTASQ